MINQLTVTTNRQGLHEITTEIATCIRQAAIQEGLCTLFLQHTSASLIIQENADPAARHDLERWLCRLVKEGDALYTHTMEGPDDMPSHIKTALTASNLAIPVVGGRLALGTWQGIFLWEHRHGSNRRQFVVHISP